MDFSHRISGYLVLSVSGKYPERFVNLCALKGIYITDAVRTNDGIILCTLKKDFRKMTVPAKRSGCRVRIIKKAGLPFFAKKIFRRKFLMLGAVAFLLTVGILNSFVWSIRIEGNEKLTKEEIKILANYCGLRQGVVKYKVDEKSFSEKALASEPRLSWIWPEIKGTVCYIRVREKELRDKPVDTKEPARVIAKRSGIITDITVKRGRATVSVGDSVVRGQELISPVTEGSLPTHAMGDVYASFWTKSGCEVRHEKEIITYTGREKNYYSIVIGSFGMSFRFSSKAPYECYSEKKSEKEVLLFGEIPLPLRIIRTEYKEAVKDKIVLTEEKAVSEAEKKIIADYKKELPEGVEIKNTLLKTEKLSDRETYVTVIFECSENIALTQKTD
ncbi:MAG: sporulation protein YqfD [Clostridia bacterium]|nr:sporulation protein YqfD [Clostridia bacterium]